MAAGVGFQEMSIGLAAESRYGNLLYFSAFHTPNGLVLELGVPDLRQRGVRQREAVQVTQPIVLMGAAAPYPPFIELLISGADASKAP